MKLGLDVSYHNGKVDFEAAKAHGVEFIIARCGYGPKRKMECSLDETFFDNVERAHKAGLQVGTYFYSYALTPEEAHMEGKWVKDLITSSGILLERGIWLDEEDACSFKVNNNFNFSSDNVTAICQAFLDEMKPLDTGVYASLSRLDAYIDWQKLGCSVWSAQWVSENKANSLSLEQLHQYNKLPTYMWQFTDAYNINGKIFDANILYV